MAQFIYVRQVRILFSQHVSSPPFEYYLRLGDKTRKCREFRKKDQRIFLLLLTLNIFTFHSM